MFFDLCVPLLLLSSVSSTLCVLLFPLLEFPQNCTTYAGNHSTACLQNVWENVVGCLKEGGGHPSSLTPVEVAAYAAMDLK